MTGWWSRWPRRMATAQLAAAYGGRVRDVATDRRDRSVDAGIVLLAALMGALIVSTGIDDPVNTLASPYLQVDVVGGVGACAALCWRRRWPGAVALVCTLLGAVSSAATIAGLLALSSLALHRPARPTLLVAALWVPSALVYAVYVGRDDPSTVLLLNAALLAAAVGWGMYVRARRQLLNTLRERAQRAEAEQQLQADAARVAERTRIAREMHDVLAHRISLLALHAGGLEVRPDLPPDTVRQSAKLLRTTAAQALEELRDVIGVLREPENQERLGCGPQPGLVDIPPLIDGTRRSGTDIELEIRLPEQADVPGALGRDAYRIVQEALTNVRKHGGGTAGRVSLVGGLGAGLHISVRNQVAAMEGTPSTVPGAGAGLIGLRERVTLNGGTLTHGLDGSGDFVVEATLRW